MKAHFFQLYDVDSSIMIQKIKSDPCFTTDLKKIAYCENYYANYTIIISDSHATNEFHIKQKKLPHYFKERKLIVDKAGCIKIFNNGVEVQEDIHEYIFSEKALKFAEFFKSEKDNIQFTVTPNPAPGISTITLQTEYQPDEKKFDLSHAHLTKQQMTPTALRYVLQIDRKGNLTLLCELKGYTQHVDAHPKKCANHFFVVKSINDIPDSRMKKYYQNRILPLLSKPQRYIAAKL